MFLKNIKDKYINIIVFSYQVSALIMICLLLLFVLVLIMLTHQQWLPFCQGYSRDEYTSEKIYFKEGLGLTNIPTDIPLDALQVYLRNNRFTILEANIFSNLSQCSSLRLYGNEISEIKPGAFNGLRALIHLGSGSNNLNCTVPKSRAAVDYTLTGVEPHGPTQSE